MAFVIGWRVRLALDERGELGARNHDFSAYVHCTEPTFANELVNSISSET